MNSFIYKSTAFFLIIAICLFSLSYNANSEEKESNTPQTISNKPVSYYKIIVKRNIFLGKESNYKESDSYSEGTENSELSSKDDDKSKLILTGLVTIKNKKKAIIEVGKEGFYVSEGDKVLDVNVIYIGINSVSVYYKGEKTELNLGESFYIFSSKEKDESETSTTEAKTEEYKEPETSTSTSSDKMKITIGKDGKLKFSLPED
jgi:hypothetical protein